MVAAQLAHRSRGARATPAITVTRVRRRLTVPTFCPTARDSQNHRPGRASALRQLHLATATRPYAELPDTALSGILQTPPTISPDPDGQCGRI